MTDSQQQQQDIDSGGDEPAEPGDADGAAVLDALDALDESVGDLGESVERLRRGQVRARVLAEQQRYTANYETHRELT